MASLTELDARLRDVENIIHNAVLIPNFCIDVNDPFVKVGSNVMGTKTGINSGSPFAGIVLVAPPTTDAHITFISRVL